MEKVCRDEVSAVAIKTIRFLDLKRLEYFYSENYDKKFRVVMLVRDPRNMYHSRKKILLMNHVKMDDKGTGSDTLIF